jgi:hypothetical protein
MNGSLKGVFEELEAFHGDVVLSIKRESGVKLARLEATSNTLDSEILNAFAQWVQRVKAREAGDQTSAPPRSRGGTT